MSNYLVTDSDLTSVANAIRAKSGGSSQLAFPAGFVSEIQAIPSGGGDKIPLDNTGSRTSFTLALQASFSGDVVINIPDKTLSAQNLFTGATFPAGSKATINALAISNGFSMAYNTSGLKTLEVNLSTPMTYPQRLISGSVTHVTGTPLKIASTGASGGYGFQLYNIEEIRFVENTAAGNCALGGSGTNGAYLSDETIISIANALQAASGLVLTLHATPKARCSTIMGRSEQVTVDGVTYSRFVADSSGTLSLADFITNTKGWTLA